MTAAFASALFSAAWKGTLLVAFALVVHRVARNRIPSRWLCALLLVALVRLLAPIAPAASFSVFNLLPSRAAPRPATVIIDQAPLPPSSPDRTSFRIVERPPASPPWVPLALGAWALGALFFLARVIVQTRRFRRALRDCRPLDLGPLLDECRDALHLRRGVRVAATKAVTTPSLHGWLRPTLLLPDRFLESFSREQVRYVLLHELAHLRRADVLVSWIATAASVLHWFNPLVRLAVARLAEERELACDALALQALPAEERPAYGGTVLAVAERTAPMVPALVGMTATPQQLKRRIVMIATFRKQSRSSVVFAAMVALVALVTLTDANAGENVIRARHFESRPMSDADHAQIVRLEQRMNLEFRAASLQDILSALTNATGVNAKIADDIATSELPRINVKAENLPAHVLLMETLSTFKLAAKFTEAGVEAVKEPVRTTLIERAPGEDRVVFIRPAGDPSHAPAGEIRMQFQKKIDGTSGDEAGKVSLTVRSGDGGPEGKLEIEVVK